MAIPVEYIGKQRRWLQAGVPTERANQSMHESSLVVSIANVHPSATIQTVANAKPIVREPRDRGRPRRFRFEQWIRSIRAPIGHLRKA